MKVKIVTVYWMDVQGYPYQGVGDVRKPRYLGSLIAHCQNLGYPIICYTHEKSKQELENLKEKHKLENLEIKILELQDVKKHHQINKIREDKFNTDLDGRGPEIMWGKFDALEKELSDVDRLYWIDVGLQHPGIIPWMYCKKYNTKEIQTSSEEIKNWYNDYEVFNFPGLLTKNLIDKINSFTDNKIVQISSYGPQIQMDHTSRGVVEYVLDSPFPVGGFFGGDVKIMKKYIDNFWFFSDKVLEKNFLCTEEYIMKPALDKIPNNEKENFIFSTFSCCEHDQFHFEIWKEEDALQIPKPFYYAFHDMLNYKN